MIKMLIKEKENTEISNNRVIVQEYIIKIIKEQHIVLDYIIRIQFQYHTLYTLIYSTKNP